ncbi:MAG: tryptophan--tRNA ligase [Candidatus Shapirobacteria bacterium]
MLKNFYKIGKPVLISGIQPTGKLHIGNYLGALKNFVDLQNSERYKCYFFVADLHSITESYDPKKKPGQVLNLVLDYLSAGLSAEKSTIFIQSKIPAHSETAWILNTVTPFGELKRMTQFKDKSEHQRENINVGLFDYPVLMASDILLYDAEFVPVGEDQLQHLELTRTLARKFNKKFGGVFIEPKPLLTETPKIMSLDNPNKKMSKSMPDGCLFVDDSPQVITEKIKRAVTDSGKEIKYQPESKPAISNLLRIYKSLSGLPMKEIEKKYKGKTYAQFKKGLSDVTIDYFMPFQKKKKLLSKNLKKVNKIIKDGNKKAEAIANKKLLEIKKAVGLL